jgi:hypothetical protein
LLTIRTRPKPTNERVNVTSVVGLAVIHYRLCARAICRESKYHTIVKSYICVCNSSRNRFSVAYRYTYQVAVCLRYKGISVAVVKR